MGKLYCLSLFISSTLQKVPNFFLTNLKAQKVLIYKVLLMVMFVGILTDGQQWRMLQLWHTNRKIGLAK